ncbi:MAG: hypothetical protein ACYDHH_23470 [Solirubrobacteraceae bacterium]
MAHEAEHDPAQMLMAARVDELADRLASRLVPKIADLVNTTAPSPSAQTQPAGALWTTRRVAEHYGVAVGFIYQHADELGCIRLGGSSRPRLRFDPDVVRVRWPLVSGRLPELAPTHRRPTSRGRSRRRPADASSELLKFDREP